MSKIKRVAQFEGIEIIEVVPAYTSIIGMLKYAPQLNIGKDIAGAYVIGRRALGFEEKIPKNYLKLLSDREYLEYAIRVYEEKEQELKNGLQKETNEYKKNTIKSELVKIQREKELLLASFQGELRSCLGANGRNSEQGKKPWQVLKVAFLFPVLGQILPRNLSPLKPALVEGVWYRVRSRLVPLEAEGTAPN